MPTHEALELGRHGDTPGAHACDQILTSLQICVFADRVIMKDLCASISRSRLLKDTWLLHRMSVTVASSSAAGSSLLSRRRPNKQIAL